MKVLVLKHVFKDLKPNHRVKFILLTSKLKRVINKNTFESDVKSMLVGDVFDLMGLANGVNNVGERIDGFGWR